ncbi:uncharacterized protein LOC111276776 isoform X2 [Durio zibethinus]|uniref:Uncharacterized protein LOC111276776 isoform X2 n=1 Tax=Durio zibethinus TaxID=66656 RepID=A0A6P5WQB6_DURZI|nr:uncharacterized protein LOC111276776 isoform X2 [Durio zibethinus]
MPHFLFSSLLVLWASRRIFQLLDRVSSMAKSGDRNPDGDVELNDVWFAYPSRPTQWFLRQWFLYYTYISNYSQVVKAIPVLVEVCGTDAFRRMDYFLKHLNQLGSLGCKIFQLLDNLMVTLDRIWKTLECDRGMPLYAKCFILLIMQLHFSCLIVSFVFLFNRIHKQFCKIFDFLL